MTKAEIKQELLQNKRHTFQLEVTYANTPYVHYTYAIWKKKFF